MATAMRDVVVQLPLSPRGQSGDPVLRLVGRQLTPPPQPRVVTAEALGDLSESHAVLERLLAALAVVPGLEEVDVALGGQHADEALVANHVSPFGVSVDLAVLRPLSKATVFSLCKGQSNP